MMKFVTFIGEQRLGDRERIKMPTGQSNSNQLDPKNIKYHDTVRG